MSATIEAERISEYFFSCPVVVVPGRTFPVDTVMLDDVYAQLALADPDSDLFDETEDPFRRSNLIPYDLIEALLLHIARDPITPPHGMYEYMCV